jgi:acetoacetyl-CoA synthetase
LERGETFVDGGGDSLKLLTLVFDIERQLGIALPVANFDLDMTARDMAQVIDAALEGAISPPSRRDRTSAVLLKSGTGQPSVFIAPGVHGYASEMNAVARHLASVRPVFGLQSAGLNAGALPTEIIMTLAAQYVAAITEIQPRGPYVLIGYSFGGLIMLEAARILRSQGEEIALTALLDSYPNPQFWPMHARLKLLAKKAGHYLNTMRRLQIGAIAPYAAVKAARLIPYLPPSLGYMLQSLRESLDAGSGTLADVPRDHVEAEARHPGSRYHGKVVFFVPEVPLFPVDPLFVWRKWVSQLEIITVPGDHLTMRDAYADALAAALDRSIASALAKQ